MPLIRCPLDVNRSSWINNEYFALQRWIYPTIKREWIQLHILNQSMRYYIRLDVIKEIFDIMLSYNHTICEQFIIAIILLRHFNEEGGME